MGETPKARKTVGKMRGARVFFVWFFDYCQALNNTGDSGLVMNGLSLAINKGMKHEQPVFSKWIIARVLGGILLATFASQNAMAKGKPQKRLPQSVKPQAAKMYAVRKPAAAAKAQPLLKVVKEESVIENTVEAMDKREASLQNCLLELKVPTYYEANVNRSRQMVELTEVADAKKTVYSFGINPSNRTGNLDVENFFKSAAYNRLLKEVRAKEEIMAQVKKPNIFQRMLGIETGYDKLMKKYDYTGAQCAQFLSSVGRGKFANDLTVFIQSHQANLMALKGKQPQPMNLSYYAKGAPRPGLASLSP